MGLRKGHLSPHTFLGGVTDRGVPMYIIYYILYIHSIYYYIHMDYMSPLIQNPEGWVI